MIKIYKSSAALLLLLPVSLASLAADPKATTPEPMQGMQMHQGMDMPMHQGMGMGMGMSEEQLDSHLRNQQEYQLKMHDLSNKILTETDPAKKEELKKQQLDLMKAHHKQKMEHRQEMKGQRQEMKQKPHQMMQPETKTK